MAKTKWFWLQLFAGEGAGASAGGEGGGDGAVTGENDGVAAEHQRLLELGVPEEKLRKRAKRASAKLPECAVRTAPMASEQAQEQVATAEENPTEENTEQNAPTRMSWDEIMADPEYNKQMQAVVQSRLREAKKAEESLSKLAPALELLARRHGLDAENMDYEAIAKAINDDDAFYEDKALEMGVSLETAKRIDQQERDTARQQRQEQQAQRQQQLQQHFMKMQQQGEALKRLFPDFDLRKELQDPAFADAVRPGGRMSVAQAYYGLHHDEIMSAGMQVTAQQTAQKLSNAIQAGSRRPDENGTSGQSASVTTFDYSKASKAQRDALKQQIRAAAARGEKLYPGR